MGQSSATAAPGMSRIARLGAPSANESGAGLATNGLATETAGEGPEDEEEGMVMHVPT